MMLSEGQMSGYKGAALMLDAIPDATIMLADKGHDADLLGSAPQAARHRLLHPLEVQSPDAARL